MIRTTQRGQPRVDLRIGGADIFIAPVGPQEGVGAAPPHPHRGLDHFGLFVRDLDAVVADLKRRGAEFAMEPNNPRPDIRICFLRGPEDVSIELLERDPRCT